MSYKIEDEYFLRLERTRYNNHSLTKIFVYKCRGIDCLKEVKVQQCALKTHSRKCKSCSQKGRPFESLYNEMKKGASRRHIQVDLSYDDFLILTKIKNCSYCGDRISWNKFSRNNGKILSRSYNIDRRNNSKGYTLDNCTVCCFRCNHFKGIMNEFEFLELCKKITDYTV